MKVFLAKWGDWEPEHCSYHPNQEVVDELFFSEDNGYEPKDINFIRSLKVGQTHNEIHGNHTITRTE